MISKKFLVILLLTEILLIANIMPIAFGTTYELGVKENDDFYFQITNLDNDKLDETFYSYEPIDIDIVFSIDQFIFYEYNFGYLGGSGVREDQKRKISIDKITEDDSEWSIKYGWWKYTSDVSDFEDDPEKISTTQVYKSPDEPFSSIYGIQPLPI